MNIIIIFIISLIGSIALHGDRIPILKKSKLIDLFS